MYICAYVCALLCLYTINNQVKIFIKIPKQVTGGKIKIFYLVCLLEISSFVQVRIYFCYGKSLESNIHAQVGILFECLSCRNFLPGERIANV